MNTKRKRRENAPRTAQERTDVSGRPQMPTNAQKRPQGLSEASKRILIMANGLEALAYAAENSMSALATRITYCDQRKPKRESITDEDKLRTCVSEMAINRSLAQIAQKAIEALRRIVENDPIRSIDFDPIDSLMDSADLLEVAYVSALRSTVKQALKPYGLEGVIA